ncbi:choice-of-anchor D domain-containing protein [Flavobacterium sp.]|uniref:choice-of-anchor D domain-containing protein n=1 Tax=Flavobacterium sp. TaxID=239 RepID=UPI0024875711|nr:choice-of-anchor D domain-containing protein [Flavobacterium sp.]MDI1317068.1 choice-of-anchor D domain-containing protein [Flavobacterium sp.]
MKKLLLKSEKLMLLIVLLIVSSISRGQSTQTYTSIGSFITPAGVTTVKAEAYGAGGAGGYGGGSNKNGGGGGGGGGYSVLTTATVTPGSTYTMNVGTGGTATATTTSGNGTTTSATFDLTSIIANGGAGGRRYSGGATGGNGGNGATFDGGKGGTGLASGSAGGGGAAGPISDGGLGSVTAGGISGGGFAGTGANGTTTNLATGNTGNIYGGGGSGGTRNSFGGNGAGGYMIITYTCPTYALTSVTSPDKCGVSASVITLTSTATSLPVGEYTVAYTAAGATSISSSASMTVTTAGTGTFTTAAINIGTTTITITNLTSSYCTNTITSNNTVIIEAYSTPSANAGTAIATCNAGAAINITAGASASSGASVLWTSNGTGTFVDANTTTACTYTPSAADIILGSVNLTFTATYPGCGSVSSTKTLTFTSSSTAIAGGNITLCSTSVLVNITGGSSASNYSTLTWSSSGTGTFTNSNSLTTCTYSPSAADVAAGSVLITLTAASPGCTNATATKTLTINSVATAVAGTAINACSIGGPINITTGSSATNYSSLLWTSNGTGTFANATSLTTCTYTPSAADIIAGSRTLTLTAFGNSPCGNVTSTKTITIKNTIVAISGSNITACSTAGAINITTGATSVNHTGINWTSSGTGTFANANSLTTCTYTPSAADISAGSVTIILTSSNGACPDVVSNKTLTINGIATSVAGTAIYTCNTTGAVNITAGASATNYSSVAWTSNGSGTFANANSLTNCTYTPSAADITAGSRTLTLTAFGNAPCGNAVSTKTIFISRAMTAVAGTAITTCSSVGAISIVDGASATNQTSVLWSSTGTGTFSNPTALTPCTYTPSAADITAGSVVITLTASNAGCADATSNKTVTISTLPTAVAGPTMTACTASGATNITGGSSATNQTSVTWTSSGTGTFANANSLTTCTYNPSAADITAGSVILTLTAFGNAACGNATSTKTLTITVSPTVTGTTPGSRTGAGTVLLGATASIGTLNWYAAATGGSSLGTGTSFTTPVISTTTTFYVEAINGSCPSATRTPVVATVNYTEIDILGNATSIVNGDTTPTTLDWTDYGTTNTTRAFTIRNTGFALLTVGTISISGANASEFTVTTPPASAVGIGGSTTFVVTFAPTAIGIRTATISVVNNDADENPYTFAIQGNGVEQEIDVLGNGASIVDGDTTPTTADWTDFNNVAGTRTFTIRNTGSVALTIGAVTISGPNASDFTVTTLPASSIAANSSTTFVVTFNPSAINIRTATISIINNDVNENPYNFSIQGFGIIPEIDIQGNTTSIPDGDITPTVADWTDFSSVAATRTFTIFNNGNIALTTGTITISGANASEFTVTTPPSATVAAFNSTTFVITFLPTAIGTRSARISIVNNDSNENPYDFSIQGTGLSREIDVQGLALSIASGDMITSVNDGTDFGSTDVNLATITRTFTIRNTGSLSLTIANPTVSGLNASEFSVTANPGTLTIGAGSSTTFSVTFNPNAVFTRVAQINIVNNDSDENPYFFAIQGTGLLDNDGDGIENNTDQDDDNDGIIDTVECGDCISDPFVNGSFETVVIGASTYSIEPAVNVLGWVNDAEPFIEIWSTGFNGVPAAAGNQFAELNANVAGTLYQSFCLNGAGGTINWSIKHRGRSGTDRADVRFGATLALAQASSPIVSMIDGNTSWGSYSGTYTIPVGQTNIVLAFIAVTSTGGLSFGNFIDDVEIIINQNCIDSDGDTVADINDVDDDNDGIPSIEEAGFKALSTNKSTMDRSSAATWVDANTNGLNDYIETMITNGTYNITDTDGDGVNDNLDLDSDNDTAFDVDESGLLNGDGDINGDGKGDGLDSDGDGLLDLFDNSTVFGTTTRAYAQDSDVNGIADYLQLDANDDGLNDIKTGLYGSLDANNDGRIDGSGDLDRDGITDTFDTNNTLIGSPRDLNRKLFLDFDGRNDYAEDASILGGLPSATLMAWIDLNSGFSSAGYVVGQTRFYIRVTTVRTLQAVINGTPITFATPLNTAQWYHVAATYGDGSLNLYLNGRLVLSQAITGNIAADTSRLTLGKNPAAASNFFKGKIDEVRVFNTALTPEQVQRMVYQEIQNNASQVRGAIVPKDIGALPFANVVKYYRMDTYKDDIVDNLTTPSVDTGTGMKLYNHKVIKYQEAPMPFTTLRAGTFATAVNDVTKDIRGLDVLDFDYSIIQVKHNITETANSTDLAMFIDPAVTVNMTNDTKLQNDWYLKLDGKIDLVGKSQLVQTTNSDLEATSAGSIERDQQGQSNKFNYNYWSSPVSSINNTTINHGFTVAGVMKDGTDPNNIQNLLWTTGVNGSPTTPAMTLSSYWIFKFQNSSNAYANWSSVGQNGALLPGQGYTMKGNGSIVENQNYTFAGKPNSGIITSTVGAGNLNLCGNPYPSAIDANKFIDDNASSLKGTLYIWEHYSTNNSHNTIEYQGGYATYTKTGGTPPVAPAGISGLGSSSTIPKRFMPVGQGFFVTGSATGGTINFNNGQRLFVKEDDTVNSYTMFKNNNNTVSANPETNNANDTFEEDQFMKVRVGYNSTDNLHRQTLIGFMNENATSGFDNGYDGISIESLTNDMYFINGTDKLNISGEGFFDVNASYPIGVKNATSGNVTFVVDGKENFDDDQEIFIHDNVTQTYNSIKSQNYEVNLPAGTYDNRFTLRFTNGTSLGTVDQEANFGIGVTHSQSNSMINIKNPLQQVTVKSVALFNLLGQQVSEWKIDNQDQANIQLQVANVSTGTYIVKVITDGGNVTKKILVKK